MEKYTGVASNNSVIFEDEYFIFTRRSGVSRGGVPWKGLAVISKEGTASDKHIIEIRLNVEVCDTFIDNVRFNKYSDCYIAHGMRSTSDTLDDTLEYIKVLEDAVEFAEAVNSWLFHNNGGLPTEE